MNELRALMLLELRSLYGFNKARYTKDRKERNRSRAMVLIWAFLGVLVFSYVAALVHGLWVLDMAEIVPDYLCMVASLLILGFGLFVAGNRIFGARGYDLLASSPITTYKLVLSRFLSLYVEDLVFAAAIFLPGLAVYGMHLRPAAGFYLAALVGMVLLPAIPLVISVLLGTLLMAISSRMKHKSAVQSALMVLFVIGVLLASFIGNTGDQQISQEQWATLAQSIGAMIGRVYPPAGWLHAACQGSWLHLLLFIGVSLGAMAAMVWVVSARFHGIMRRLMSFSAKHSYRLKTMERRNLIKALYLREAKRYFASSIYVTNTIVGPIMGAMMAIALCVAGLESVQRAIPVPLDIPGLLPYVFSAVFCMMTPASVSISMEGKQIWIVKSLPIPTKTWLDSKILLNLSLMLPFYVISEIAFVIGTKPDLGSLIWLLLVPASIMVLAVVLSIRVNLKLHSFDWEKEETVVKQSLPAMLGCFAGFLISAGLGLLVFLLPETARGLANGGVCLLLWAVTAVLYLGNNKVRIELL